MRARALCAPGASYRRARVMPSIFPWMLPQVSHYWDMADSVVTGSGVSSVPPRKGSVSFAQTTDAARPSLASGILTTNGSSQWIQTGAMTMPIPSTLVSVVRQNVWSTPGHIFDGRSGGNTMAAYQYSVSPKVQLYTGASGIVAEPDSGSDWAVNTWTVQSMRWSTTTNDAFIRTNLGTKRTGANTSSTSPNGITLGARALVYDQLAAASFQAVAVLVEGFTDDELDQVIVAMGASKGVVV